ncbi:MAG: MFS transporter [Proteobacteria bacterium]|nr:MFS transporter [Pseudomonadota bacterium]
MSRNLALYPLYRGLRGLMFWLPVFFLYFQSVLDVADVLVLEALYYLGVVVAEVPSGYFSDRVGRRTTLLIAMGAWTAACWLFVLTASFVPFAAAQLGLALGMAFNSGTDSALLYDSLKALGREDEIAAHESKAQAWGLGATALAAVLGGAMAGLDMRFAYAFSALSAALAFAVAWRFVEPARSRALPPVRQVVAVAGRLRDPVLRWTFLFVVAMTVFNHVPYELFQPWLELLLGDGDGAYARTPLAAGIVIGLGFAISSWASTKAAAWGAALGLRRGMFSVLAVQSAVMAAMAVAVHPIVVGFILLRTVPSALMQPLMLSAVHPRVDSGQRATYLSLQSLAGRLAFSLCLFATAKSVGGLEALDHGSMRGILLAYLGGAGAVAGVLWWLGRGTDLDGSLRNNPLP